MQDVDLNSDAMMGSVQNGIHHALFEQRDVISFLFKMLLREWDELTVNAKLDRNDGKEIKCDLLIYICSVPMFFLNKKIRI